MDSLDPANSSDASLRPQHNASDREVPAVTPAEGLMDGAFAVSAGGMLHDQPVDPYIRLHSRDPRKFIVENNWHEFSGDLSQGLILQRTKNSDSVLSSPICHSGNIFECRGFGSAHSFDVEANIVDFGIRRLPGCVVLYHESSFQRASLPFLRPRPCARLLYEYALCSNSPILRLTVTLTAEPGARLVSPRITTALDDVSPSDAPTFVSRVITWTTAGKAASKPRHDAGPVNLHLGTARHLTLTEDARNGGEPGQAIHLRLEDGHVLHSVKGTSQAGGTLHWVILRYACPTLEGGRSFVIREERLRQGKKAIDPEPNTSELAVRAAVTTAMAVAQAKVALTANAVSSRHSDLEGLFLSHEAIHEARALRLNVKALGSAFARAYLDARGDEERSAAPLKPINIGVGSRICGQSDIEQDWLRHWCRVLGVAPRYHRKLWEDCYVPQALWEAGMLQSGKRGLGFAVGLEDLPSLFASRGVQVVATDLNAEDARAAAWVETGQHVNRVERLHRPKLVSEEVFRQLVTYRPVDMTAVPDDLLRGEFDFVWSVCALEHLGSLEAGMEFIRTTMRCLRPGGVAVHTTEYNLDDVGPTLKGGPTVLYQRHHIDKLALQLAADGHELRLLPEKSNEQGLFDQLIDVPPYPRQGGPEDAPHLRLALAGFTTTSVGLVVRAHTSSRD